MGPKIVSPAILARQPYKVVLELGESQIGWGGYYIHAIDLDEALVIEVEGVLKREKVVPVGGLGTGVIDYIYVRSRPACG